MILAFFSIFFSKIDNNYDKQLQFFQEWEIKEVKVCYVFHLQVFELFFSFYCKLFTLYIHVTKKEPIKTNTTF